MFGISHSVYWHSSLYYLSTTLAQYYVTSQYNWSIICYAPILVLETPYSSTCVLVHLRCCKDFPRDFHVQDNCLFVQQCTTCSFNITPPLTLLTILRETDSTSLLSFVLLTRDLQLSHFLPVPIFNNPDVAFLDLRVVFDSLDHTILLNHLHKLRVATKLLWFCHCLLILKKLNFVWFNVWSQRFYKFC